ncbi:MAG: sigma-70 family RNA polymerase sigma factor [Lachnospiraceae bacterium]|nr:sigma-70 family RNA polymerase sigma factor [Lachnospiraceae bacterium]
MMMTIWRMNAWEKLNPSVHQKRIGGRIANEILMYFRSRKKLSREVSIFEPMGTDKEGNEINLLDMIEAEQRDFAELVQLNEDTKRLENLIDQVLEPREKEILLMRYGLRGYRELTQREIGDKLKISRSYISRIEKRSLEKLRLAISKKN